MAADVPSATSAAEEKISALPSWGGEKIWCIDRIFDLDDILDAKHLDADTINLMNLPAKSMILAASLEVTEVQVGGTSTCTAALQAAGTGLVAALSISATGYADMANAAAPVGVATADYLELLLVITSGTVTRNATVKVRVFGVNCA